MKYYVPMSKSMKEFHAADESDGEEPIFQTRRVTLKTGQFGVGIASITLGLLLGLGMFSSIITAVKRSSLL